MRSKEVQTTQDRVKPKIHIFDDALKKANDWIADILEESGWTHPQSAYSALKATLHALRDRLPPDEAMDLASEFPMLIRGMFFEGWRLSDKPDKSIKSKDDFLDKVAQHFGRNSQVNAEEMAAVVFRVLSKKITSGEVRQVRMSLPERLRKVWPEAPLNIQQEDKDESQSQSLRTDDRPAEGSREVIDKALLHQ